MTSEIRLILACGLFSAWMVLLFTGWVWGGFVHLVLLLALYLVPWRMNRKVGSATSLPDSEKDGT